MDTPFTTKIESSDGESERKRKRGGNCLNSLFLFYRDSPVPFTFRSNLPRTLLLRLERTSSLVTPLSACDALSITLLTHTARCLPCEQQMLSTSFDCYMWSRISCSFIYFCAVSFRVVIWFRLAKAHLHRGVFLLTDDMCFLFFLALSFPLLSSPLLLPLTQARHSISTDAAAAAFYISSFSICKTRSLLSHSSFSNHLSPPHLRILLIGHSMSSSSSFSHLVN